MRRLFLVCSARGAVAAAGIVFLTCLSLVAQTPARQGGSGTSQAAGPGSTLFGIDNSGADFSPKPPVQPLSPEEQARRFVLPPGYRLEPVLAEPHVVSPGTMAFDGNGRLYVAELRTYMLDADATGQTEPRSRISRHESTKGDGVFDRHTVFVDNIRTPRMVVPLDGNSILTMETDSDDVLKFTDTDGDGVADRREVFFSGAGRRGNLEHQPSGFIWALDNWIYSTYNAFRIRWTPNGILKEPTAPNGGQWGLTQDDYGKVWFVDAGGERGPVNFQAPIHYGAFNVEDQFEPDFRVTWPLGPGLADMQGGMMRVRMPVGVLNHFTATCGQEIYRGDRLPDDLRGDLLFAEPVGRLIRRAKVEVTGGITRLRNAYPQSEFILSTDPLFRPVDLKTGPDGALYIADMYHGIIQESNWVRPGSYLRRKIHQYGLDKIVGYGRIWRLVHESKPLNHERPRMLDETPAQLVAHLAHPNGWWRDTAQKLLVLRQDTSVEPALREMVKTSPSLLARFHAMWTLEGLGLLDAALVRELLADPHPQMRVQAIRASESLYKAGDRSFERDVRELTEDGDATVVIQAMLTLNLWKVPDIEAVVRTAQNLNRARGVREIGDQILAPPMTTFGGSFRLMTVGQRAQMEEGAGIYAELCYSCHGTDGKGAPLAGAPAGTLMAPSLVGSLRVTGHRDYVIKTLLHGMTGPLEGTSYLNVMVPMGENQDSWIAAVASYVRNSWGNSAPFVRPEDVARVRAATKDRTTSWTVEELEASVPAEIEWQDAWKATASHNPEAAARAFARPGGRGGGWTSGAAQQEGMWFEVQLPSAVSITEVEFDSAAVPSRTPPPPPAAPAGRASPSRTERTRPAAATGPTGAPQPGTAARGAAAPATAAARVPEGPPPLPDFPGTYPRRFKVQASTDGQTWGAPIAEGSSSGSPTVIAFPPVTARAIRITLTATDPAAPAWTVQRLRLYGPPRPLAERQTSQAQR
ncbi:MAG TPA: c-type cytochrome [Vicinamibacterales bacterium]